MNTTHPHSPATHVAPATKVKEFAYSIGPLFRANMLRRRTFTNLKLILPGLFRWGVTQAAVIEQDAADYPHRVAIIDDFGTLTYQELRDQARTMALNLMTQGIGQGSTIAIQARNSRATVLLLIASAYLGACPMIVNVGSSAKQITAIFDSYGADYFIFDEEYADTAHANAHIPGAMIVGAHANDGSVPSATLEDLPKVVPFSELVTKPVSTSVSLPLRPKQQPVVIMSSGTYGVPKGVVLPSVKNPRVIGGIIRRIPWRGHRVVQLTASMFHAWGWVNVQLGVASGSTIVLRRYYDPEQAADDIVTYGVRAIVSAAVFLRDLIDVMEKRNMTAPPMDFIASSGNAIPPHLMQRIVDFFGPVLYNFYGSTEHGQIAISDSSQMLADPSNVGQPNVGVEVKVLREDGSEADTGEIGIVYAANSMTMYGFASGQYTPETRDGLLSTGDLGYLDEKGCLHLQGRADDMVIKGGENVFPREVEAFIGQLDEVADVYVQGVQDDVIATLDAFVVRSEAGQDLTDDELRTRIRNGLAQHNVPDNIYWVDSLPRNDGGKVVPRLLREQIK